MTNRDFLEFVYVDSNYLDFSNYKDVEIPNILSLALLLSALYLEKPQKIAVVLPTLYDAQSLMDYLSDYLDQEELAFFPFDEVIRIDSIGTSPEMRQERLNAMYRAHLDRPVIFVTHAASMMRRIRNYDVFKENITTIKKGDIYDKYDLIKVVTNGGYKRVNKVTHCFEYAVRGEIFDIWSANYLNPIRLEFDDDVIEDIRHFSPTTELSNQELEEMTIIPSSEFILSDNEKEVGIENIEEALKNRRDLSKLLLEELDSHIAQEIETIRTEGLQESNSRYLPYFDNSGSTIASFLKDFKTIIYHYDDIESVASNYKKDEGEFYRELFKSGQSLALESIYARLEETLYNLDKMYVKDGTDGFMTTDVIYHNSNLATSRLLIESLVEEGYQVRVCLKDDRRMNFISHMFEENLKVTEYPKMSSVTLFNKSLINGFTFKNLVFLSASEIFGLTNQSGRFFTRFKEAKIIKKFEELEIGDYVVNEVHGIGKYIGIFDIDGIDNLKIQYAGEGNFLFVPLSKFKLIRKYVGKEGNVPTLDSLGGATWARRKEKIKNRVSYLADRLLVIYAERMSKPGFAFPSEEEMESSFANAFPYPLTSSQIDAWEDINKDMGSPHPMDRLIAGDVGFGKTELAFRACYKAILAGKQAAILCPTTILAKQHYEVAIKRFSGFGVEIACLSRFIKPSELERNLKRIAEGKVHLIIGTHKLLSDNVAFKELGLLVIDEEQRFGVTHKEKIKEMTTNIDVLTLTATPIPRTLQMSLLNVKSLSLLSQAPQNRMPIKTYVSKYDKGLVKEVVARELARKGQIYYLHNRINTIYSKAKELQKMFPLASISVVHGSMTSDEIGDVMNDFYDGKIDILVCTTIIETGLDIPNVNTIVIEKADHFGLAQLYQIKGRVGRSNRLAYAYLFYDQYEDLTEQGRKRLKAIKEFTELGSGYKIANQDLNIRGAGDILGKEQAGFVDSIGYDSYIKLVNEVMNEKKLAESGSVSSPLNKYELSFTLDCHIPYSYACDSDRIIMYQELSEINNFEDLYSYEKKLRDVYGPLPCEMRNLFLKKEIELYLNDDFIEQFVENIDRFILTLSMEFTNRDGFMNVLESGLESYYDEISIRFIKRHIVIIINRSADYLLTLYNIVSSLYKMK